MILPDRAPAAASMTPPRRSLAGAVERLKEHAARVGRQPTHRDLLRDRDPDRARARARALARGAER